MAGFLYQRSARTLNKKYQEYFIPTVLTAMATNIAVIINSIIAGNTLGGEAIATINLYMPLLQLYFSVTSLMGLGISTMVAMSKGRGDERGANNAFTVGIVTLAIISALVLLIQLPLEERVCSAITSNEKLAPLVREFYIPFILDVPVKFFMLYAVYCIRLDARPQFSSIVVIVSNAVNLLAVLIFLTILGMGIAGVAMAILIGDSVGILLVATHFISKKNTFKFDLSSIESVGEFFSIQKRILTIGLSGALGPATYIVRLQFLNWFILKIGTSVDMIAYSVAMSGSILVSMFITGASQALTPIVGMCVGERDYRGVRYALKRALTVLMIASIVLTLLMVFFPALVLGLFGVNLQECPPSALSAVWIIALSLPFDALLFLFIYYYATIQRRMASTVISLLKGIVFTIPTAIILAWFFGIKGVWISFPVAGVLTLLVMVGMVFMVCKRSNGELSDFYLIKKKANEEIISLSFDATRENAEGISEFLEEKLLANGVDKNIAMRLAIVAEEMAVNIAGRAKKRVNADIRVFQYQAGLVMSIRDNGAVFDLSNAADTEDNKKLITEIGMIKALAKKIEYTNVLGFNKTKISF